VGKVLAVEEKREGQKGAGDENRLERAEFRLKETPYRTQENLACAEKKAEMRDERRGRGKSAEKAS